MPLRRKTRTRSTRGKPARDSRRKSQIKREVAAEAARIIATEGLYNYHAAKKKAALRVGVSERLALPANLEVQEALVSYLHLYGGDAHRANLKNMRVAAAQAMKFLSPLHSRLVGPVLDGTAGPHARISLHVFCDSPDTLVHHLMDHKVSFRHEQRQVRWRRDEYRTLPVLVMEPGNFTVELLVFEELALRQAPPCPIDGRPQKRATLSQLEELVSETEGPQAASA